MINKRTVLLLALFISVGFLLSNVYFAFFEQITVLDNSKWGDRVFHILSAEITSNKTSNRMIEAWKNTNYMYDYPISIINYPHAFHAINAAISYVTGLSPEFVFSIIFFFLLFVAFPILFFIFINSLIRNENLSLIGVFVLCVVSWFQRYMLLGLISQLIITICLLLWFLVLYRGKNYLYLPLISFFMIAFHRYGIYLWILCFCLSFPRIVWNICINENITFNELVCLILMLLFSVMCASPLTVDSLSYSNSFTMGSDNNVVNPILFLLSSFTSFPLLLFIPASLLIVFVSILPFAVRFYELYIVYLAGVSLSFIDIHSRTIFTIIPIVIFLFVYNLGKIAFLVSEFEKFRRLNFLKNLVIKSFDITEARK